MFQNFPEFSCLSDKRTCNGLNWSVIIHMTPSLQTDQTTSGQFVINLKNNNQTEYCGHVVYKPSSGWDRPETESEEAEFCVKLPGQLNTNSSPLTRS